MSVQRCGPARLGSSNLLSSVGGLGDAFPAAEDSTGETVDFAPRRTVNQTPLGFQAADLGARVKWAEVPSCTSPLPPRSPHWLEPSTGSTGRARSRTRLDLARANASDANATRNAGRTPAKQRCYLILGRRHMGGRVRDRPAGLMVRGPQRLQNPVGRAIRLPPAG